MSESLSYYLARGECIWRVYLYDYLARGQNIWMVDVHNVSWVLSAISSITGCVRGVMFTDVAMSRDGVESHPF